MMHRFAKIEIHTHGRLLLHFCAGQASSIMKTFTLATGSDSRRSKSRSSTCLFYQSVREKRSRALGWSPCKLRLISPSPMQTIGQKTQNRIPWEPLPDEPVRRKDSPSYHRTKMTFKLTPTPIRETYRVKRIGQKRNPCWNGQPRTLLAEKKATYRVWEDGQTPLSTR